MSGLESSLATAEIAPIASLQFKLPSVSPYVTSRQEIYFSPAGQTFSPSGNRTMRINCSGNGFADLSSAMLEFSITNNSTTNALQPLSANGSCFFSELRFLLSGIEAERIGGGGCSYGRIVEALQRGLPSAKRVEDAGTGVGIKTADAADVLSMVKGGILMSNSIPAVSAANPGQNSKKIFMRPLLGLASQHLLLPLWAMTRNGATFEWLLQATGADAVVGTDSASVSGSTDWSITNVRLHLDILHVDEALMSSYTSHLLKGSSLVVPYRSYTPISFTHAGSNTAMLQIPRTFSRVNQIWVLPSRPDAANLFKKDCNYFPSLGSVNTLESWIQIGITMFPSTTYGPGTAEHLMRYQKALGYLGSGFHVSSNTVTSYNGDSMLIVFDLQKNPQQSMSGMSTHGGNVVININGLGTTVGATVTTASRIDVLIWHDVLAEISDGSVQISY